MLGTDADAASCTVGPLLPSMLTVILPFCPTTTRGGRIIPDTFRDLTFSGEGGREGQRRVRLDNRDREREEGKREREMESERENKGERERILFPQIKPAELPQGSTFSGHK